MSRKLKAAGLRKEETYYGPFTINVHMAHVEI